MKKRLKGLLALSLALCMVLAMTTGVASAGVSMLNYGPLITGPTINSGTVVRAGTSGDSIVYTEYNETTETVYLPDAEDKATIKKTVTALGYLDDVWTVLSNSSESAKQGVLSLKRKPIDYTIKYVADDGEDASDIETTFTVEAMDGKLIADAKTLGFTKEGYEFKEWKLERTDDGEPVSMTVDAGKSVKDIYTDLIPYAVVSDDGDDDPDTEDPSKQEIILTAVWQEAYTISYHAGKGTGSADDTSFLKNDSKVAINDGAGFTKKGYHFTQWNTEENGSGHNIPTGSNKVSDILVSLSDVFSADHKATLYAQYDPNQYSISFDPNFDTDQTMDEQELEYDKEATLEANTFTREGYTFTGWNTESDGSGESYTDKQEIKNLTAEKDATITLYAQWVASGEPGTTNPTGSTDPTGSAGSTDSTGTADSTGSTDSTASTDSNDPANGDETDTGHSFNILPWLMMATASIIGVVAAVSRRKMAK